MVTWRRLRYKRSNQANLTRGEHHVAADDMPGCATTPIFGSVRVLFQCSPVPALCHRAVGADAERGTQHVAGTGAASNGGGQWVQFIPIFQQGAVAIAFSSNSEAVGGGPT